MSMHKYIYLGPFLELHAIQASNRVDRCQIKCQLVSDQKFCAACGMELSRRYTNTTSSIPNPFQVLEGDALVDLCVREVNEVSIYYFIPNEHRGHHRQFTVSDLESPLDLSEETIETEMKWFSEAFAPELDKFRVAEFKAMYLKWGIIPHWG